MAFGQTGQQHNEVNCSYSSVGQSVRLITVRSAVQARVGAFCNFYALFLVAPKAKRAKCSDTGTRTRVSWVRAKYPNQLDYIGS
jgi:hypothetical protein